MLTKSGSTWSAFLLVTFAVVNGHDHQQHGNHAGPPQGHSHGPVDTLRQVIRELNKANNTDLATRLSAFEENFETNEAPADRTELDALLGELGIHADATSDGRFKKAVQRLTMHAQFKTDGDNNNIRPKRTAQSRQDQRGSFDAAIKALRFGGQTSLADSLAPFKTNFQQNSLPSGAQLTDLRNAMTQVRTVEAATVPGSSTANKRMKRACKNLMRKYQAMGGTYTV